MKINSSILYNCSSVTILYLFFFAYFLKDGCQSSLDLSLLLGKINICFFDILDEIYLTKSTEH